MINICYGLSINTSEKGETIMLDFRMETFLTVCNDMNFTHAAEHLNLTQPAVFPAYQTSGKDLRYRAFYKR